MPRFASFCILIYCGSTLSAGPTSADEIAPKAWQTVAGTLFGEARISFDSIADKSNEDWLGWAAARLNESPRTSGKIAEAKTVLSRIVNEEAADSATSLASQFLLARIHHIHETEPDFDGAVSGYQTVYDLAPQTVLGAVAASQLALLELNRTGAEDPATIVSYDRWAEVAHGTTYPHLAKSLHHVLAEMGTRLRLDAPRVQPHFAALARTRVGSPQLRADWQVRGAWLAEQAGRANEARAIYSDFLTENPHGARAEWARTRLADLTTTSPR
jgi:hypothetical protein